MTWVDVFMHSAQKWGCKFLTCNMLLHISARCLFFLSAISFCCGMFGQVSCRFILHSCKNCIKSIDVYSLPLSMHKHYIFRFSSFSTFSLNYLNFLKASDFSLRKSTPVYFEKSSINVIMYRKLLIDDYLTGPNTFEWTNFSGTLALKLDFSYGTWCAFPYWYPEHTMSSYTSSWISLLSINFFIITFNFW